MNKEWAKKLQNINVKSYTVVVWACKVITRGICMFYVYS